MEYRAKKGNNKTTGEYDFWLNEALTPLIKILEGII